MTSRPLGSASGVATHLPTERPVVVRLPIHSTAVAAQEHGHGRAIWLARPPASLFPSSSSVLCRSSARREKELALHERQRLRLRAQLDKTHAGLPRRPAKAPGKIERRIGRWCSVAFLPRSGSWKCGSSATPPVTPAPCKITERDDRTPWAAPAHGADLLRTHCPEQGPARLWRWHLQLCQAEDAFRISKSDLSLRPVAELLHRLGLELPSAPKIVQKAVEKNGP
jgi:hypothetical protein